MKTVDKTAEHVVDNYQINNDWSVYPPGPETVKQMIIDASREAVKEALDEVDKRIDSEKAYKHEFFINGLKLAQLAIESVKQQV